MIDVLVVDDSAVAREVLTRVIEASSDLRVVGVAADGIEAIDAVRRIRPDIVTMDIMMPRLSGPEAIHAIMQETPTPIVVVTSNTITEEVRATFQSLESGALALVPRPAWSDDPVERANAELLRQTLRLMAEVKVVRRFKPRPKDGSGPARPAVSRRPLEVVVVGASTGGPTALKALLSELGPRFPLPIILVQHIAAGFVDGFVDWLRQVTGMTVRRAAAGETLRPETVYVAPEGAHLTVDVVRQLRLTAPSDLRPGALCPSVDVLFTSIATAFGPRAAGVLLTGMGRDGAQGLLAMKRAGATTLAQDKDSAVIHGMPGEAIALGAVDHVLPPGRMAEVLRALVTSTEGAS